MEYDVRGQSRSNTLESLYNTRMTLSYIKLYQLDPTILS